MGRLAYLVAGPLVVFGCSDATAIEETSGSGEEIGSEDRDGTASEVGSGETDSDSDSGDGDGDDTTNETEGTDEGGCTPGETVCVDEQNFAPCTEAGRLGEPVPCEPSDACFDGACINACAAAEANPSSVGCSFFAVKMDNYFSNVDDDNQHDALVAGNTSQTKVAAAQLWFVPVDGDVEQPVGPPIMIEPQGTHTWILTQAEIDSVSLLQTGGVYRLATTLPVAAYQHSPLAGTFTNDASMLLPEHALTGNYVVASYPALAEGDLGETYPSYLTVIALADDSIVNIAVREASAAGVGVPAIAAGESADIVMDRYSVLNLVVEQQLGGDLSGTIITSEQPLHVMGAVEAANVPVAETFYADHLEEAMLPLEYWGQEYVGAHAPARSGNETYYWRVFAGDDAITIDTAPTQPGFPVTLDKGEFHMFATIESFVLTADGPVMPVQYLEGQDGGAESGDPSMIQSVPTEQYLDSYAFVTGEDYWVHFVQVIRPTGGADVFVDGELVTDYYTIDTYEVADVEIEEGAHFATSDQPFAIMQVGYTLATSYGYPGGLKLDVINPI